MPATKPRLRTSLYTTYQTLLLLRGIGQKPTGATKSHIVTYHGHKERNTPCSIGQVDKASHSYVSKCEDRVFDSLIELYSLLFFFFFFFFFFSLFFILFPEVVSKLLVFHGRHFLKPQGSGAVAVCFYFHLEVCLSPLHPKGL